MAVSTPTGCLPLLIRSGHILKKIKHLHQSIPGKLAHREIDIHQEWFSHMRFDVLVVGEGLAALTMLLHLPSTLKIGVISRNKHDEPSSYWAQGGISAVFSIDDDEEKHVQDTLAAGDGLCDEAAVRQIVGEGTSVLSWLIDQGVPFTREAGEIHLTREGGHSERRVAHVDDMTGRGIMRTLQAKVALLPNVIWILKPLR